MCHQTHKNKYEFVQNFDILLPLFIGPSVRNVFTPSDTHYLILCDVYSVDKVVDGVAELWWVRGGQIRILEVGAHYNILMCPKKDENFKSG